MKRYLITVALSVAAALAIAAEVSLTEEEKAHCAENGGCVFTSVGFIRERIKSAFEAGFERGKSACLKGTT